MRKIIPVLLLSLMLCACDNKNSVNVIVTNTEQRDINNVRVDVSVKEVCRLLGITTMKPIVLNEKNAIISYVYNGTHDSISFYMPVIHKDSQKTFSVNNEMPDMGNSFLRIRKNIRMNK